MKYTPTMASLGYILSEDRKRVLLIHRNARPDDLHIGKYNGLGGKMNRDEDAASCIRREIMEEANLHVTEMTLRGTISWPGFGKGGEDWFGFIFLVTGWTGTPPPTNDEGTLEWIPLEKLLSFSIPLWDGDKHFLPLIFDDEPNPFHGVMPYKDGKLLSWKYTR